MRRFYAARTLGKIGIDAQCGLVSLEESMRKTALKAVKEALEYETKHESGSVSEQICQALHRAITNLSKGN